MPTPDSGQKEKDGQLQPQNQAKPPSPIISSDQAKEIPADQIVLYCQNLEKLLN